MKKFFASIILAGLATTAFAAQPLRVVRPEAAEGSSFGAGDLLVTNQDGRVDWYHDGSLVATLGAAPGVLDTEHAFGPLYVVDAEGNQVRDAAQAAGSLFLTAEAPERVHYQKNFVRPTPLATSSVLMTWHNGTILVANKTMAIFWGSQWTSASFAGDKITGLDTFFTGWGGTSTAAASTEYTGSNGQVTASSTYLGHVIDSSAAPKRALSTSSAVAEACRVTNNNPDPNGVYFIYTSTGAGHVNYCAWHSYGTCSNGAPVQVAYMPNIDGVSGCSVTSAGGQSAGLAALANVTSHELSETITDPRNGGWYDSSNGENGDKCAWSFHSPVTIGGQQWTLQMEWSNAAYSANTGYPNRSGQNGCLQ